MSTTPETVLRRVRTVIGTQGVERLGPAGARLLLAKLLFDGAGVPDWHTAAACRDVDPELFFPDEDDCGDQVAAKAVCGSCPVQAACLDNIMFWERPGARFGIVGGLAPRERHRLYRMTRRSGEGGEAA